MKPEAAAHLVETLRNQLAAVERLTAAVARHEKSGDLKRAAAYAELLVEAQDELRETYVAAVGRLRDDILTDLLIDGRVSLDPARLLHEAKRSTHVVVGDHDPEPRGTPLSDERYAAMKARPSKGLQDDAAFVTCAHAPSDAPRWDACSGVHFPGREPTAGEII